jgi:hypothetical protein
MEGTVNMWLGPYSLLMLVKYSPLGDMIKQSSSGGRKTEENREEKQFR